MTISRYLLLSQSLTRELGTNDWSGRHRIRYLIDPNVARNESVDPLERHQAWLDQVTVERRVVELKIKEAELRQSADRLVEADVIRQTVEYERQDALLVEELAVALTRASHVEAKRIAWGCPGSC